MKMRHRPRVKRDMSLRAQAVRQVFAMLTPQQRHVFAMLKWAKERRKC